MLLRRHSCSPCHDETPHKNSHDGDVIHDVEHRTRPNADGDRDDADQRAEQREALRRQTRCTRRRRTNPRQRRAGKQRNSDHSLSNARLSVLAIITF